MKKIFLPLIIMASLTMHAADWKQDGHKIIFGGAAGGMKFVPGAYSGLQFQGIDFFIHLPVWDEGSKRRQADLRLGGKIDTVAVVQCDMYCETLAVTVPLIFLDERAGKNTPAEKYHAKLQFKLYKTLPLVKVSCIIFNDSDTPLTLAPFFLGRNLADGIAVTGTRYSPPPAHTVTEKLRPQTLPGGDWLHLTDGKNINFSIVGGSGRYRSGNMLQLFFEKETIAPHSFSTEFSATFVINSETGIPAGKLPQLVDMLKLADGTIFAHRTAAPPKMAPETAEVAAIGKFRKNPGKHQNKISSYKGYL